jgi:hypothetical protein
MYQFEQIIDLYEDESHNLSGFIASYKNLGTEALEDIILSFQALYQSGDTDCETNAFIHQDDWLAFSHWQPSDQSDFLAYLAIKIAIARS